MPLLEQSIPHLLDGVTQRPEIQSSATNLRDSKNALAMLGLGLMKRPPAQHRGKLDSGSWDFDSVGQHTINRDDNDQFRVVVEGGSVKVFDAMDDGASVIVRDKTPDSQNYLSDPTGAGFRLATIGDTTFIVNRGVEVQKGSTKSSGTLSNDAYITVEQADFSTEYKITLARRTVTFTTVDQVDARARGKITTEHIAGKLVNKLTGGQFPPSRFFTVTQHGSTIRVSPKVSDEDYEIDVDDGLGGNGLHLAKGEVQAVEDLPAKAKHGAILKVTGDPRREADDFYVQYDATKKGGSEHGVWEETVAPGVLQDFDASTMPHALVMEGPLMEDGLESYGLPSVLKIETVTAEEEVVGWTEKRVPSDEIFTITDAIVGQEPTSETVTSVQERIDKILNRHKGRLRKLLPTGNTGAEIPTGGSAERDVDIRYDVDTSLVRTGIETYVNLNKVDSNDNRTLLKQHKFPPGETFPNQEFEVRKETFSDGDSIEIELEYQDGLDQPRDRRAELHVFGAKKEAVGYQTVKEKVIRFRDRKFVELTYDYDPDRPFFAPGVSFDPKWPEGAEVRVELDSAVEFTHIVPSGGQTNAEVATAVASLIDAHADYQATSPQSGVVRLSDSTASTYPIVSDTENEIPDSVFFNPEMDLVADELVGNDAFNLTDGSVGSITANSKTTITAALSGGADNVWSTGDVIHVEGTDRYFTIRDIGWDLRQAGDDESNEYPSFTGNTIDDVVFHRNRLGFVSGESISLSRNGDLFQFFRTSVVDVLDDDRIDVDAAHSEVTLFHSAFEWNGDLHLWSEAAQFLLGSGGSPLSPKTVTIDHLSSYHNDPDVPPVPGGQALYFAAEEDGSTRVFRYVVDADRLQANAQDMTRGTPTLIPGSPRDLAVSPTEGVLAASSSGDKPAVFVFTWTRQGDQLVHAGWNRWELPSGSEVGKLDMLGGKLGILSEHGSDGVYISDIGLNPSVTPDANEPGRYLDRRVDSANDALSPSYDGTDTTWTLPYTPQDPDAVRVFRRDTQALLNPTVSGTSVSVPGDLTSVNVWIGSVVPFEAELLPFRLTESRGEKETRGHLSLRTLEVYYHDTTDLTLQWTPEARSSYSRSVSHSPPDDGTLRSYIMSLADTTTIKLLSSGAGGARISSLSWEGRFNRRSKRVR